MEPAFDITFREMMPESYVIELVREQLSTLSGEPARHCSVVMAHSPNPAEGFSVRIELERRSNPFDLYAHATDRELEIAIRRAFLLLRHRMEVRLASADDRAHRSASMATRN